MIKRFEVGPIALLPLSFEYFFNLLKSIVSGRSEIAAYRVYGKKFKARSRGFLWLYKEFVLYKKHDFKCSSDSPVVVDVGTNTGVGIVAIKKQYPKARIWAFEADPEIVSVLKWNLANQGLGDDIEVESCAAWVEDCDISFSVDGHGGGSLKKSENMNKQLTVRGLDLDRWLENFPEEKIDLFKLDVEGAEFEILKHCKNHLSRISKAIVEFHISREENHQLGEVIGLFENAGLFVKFIDPNSWPVLPLTGCTVDEYRYEGSFDIYFSRK